VFRYYAPPNEYGVTYYLLLVCRSLHLLARPLKVRLIFWMLEIGSSSESSVIVSSSSESLEVSLEESLLESFWSCSDSEGAGDLTVGSSTSFMQLASGVSFPE
jgi:hypothetical protein